MIRQFTKYCTDKIKDEEGFISEGLLEGSVKTFEDYRHTTGVLRGLDIAREIIFATADAYEEETEDA
jgi:hypothetical protein